ncbi:MAG: pyrroloquinoline quinone-dependent dehydrogenase, partial [Terriglobia bacterium]
MVGRTLIGLIAAVALSSAPLPAQDGAGAEWRHYAADLAATRFSPLTQINRSNVAKLAVAWTFRTGDAGEQARTTIECTPLVVDGVMYVTSPLLKTIALDPATGREIWRFDPFEASGGPARDVSRGVTYWQDGDDKRILFGASKYLYCLNARTGKPAPGFGDNGMVDLSQGL